MDSIASSPTVRLDLNDLAFWEVATADTTPPTLRRQTVQSMQADGGHIPASAYDFRTVRLNLELLRNNENNAASQRQLLERELARPRNILEYRPDGATASVFFRTYRSEIEQTTRQPAIGQSFYIFDLPLMAEPFAYGLQETLSTVTLSNNPAVANGLRFIIDAADVKGDVETPLCLRGDNGSEWSGRHMAWGMRRTGTPSSAPLVAQAEAMTQGTNTATVANGASYSPTSGTNTSETTFATDNTLTPARLSINIPVSAGPDGRGAYRVYARVHGDGALSNFDIGMSYGGITFDTVNQSLGSAASSLIYIDLGLLQVPTGQDPVEEGPSGVVKDVAPSTLSLHARRNSGSSNLVWDFIVFVPADDLHGIVKWNTAMTSAEECVVDSYNRRAYVQTAAGDAITSQFGIVETEGGWPMVTPNQTARLTIVPQVRSQAIPDAIATTKSITPYYWPRYLDVRPAST